MSRRRIAQRLHRARSLAANTYYFWAHRHYSLRMAWHMAKLTIN